MSGVHALQMAGAGQAVWAAAFCILLSNQLWTGHACGDCQSNTCVSYGFGSRCTCLPSNEHCSVQKASDNAASVIRDEGQHITQTVIDQVPTASRAVQLANACVADVYGCATTQLMSYVPNLDTQVCGTAASKTNFEQGVAQALRRPSQAPLRPGCSCLTLQLSSHMAWLGAARSSMGTMDFPVHSSAGHKSLHGPLQTHGCTCSMRRAHCASACLNPWQLAAGGWSAYYGSRIWDSEAAGTVRLIPMLVAQQRIHKSMGTSGSMKHALVTCVCSQRVWCAISAYMHLVQKRPPVLGICMGSWCSLPANL